MVMRLQTVAAVSRILLFSTRPILNYALSLSAFLPQAHQFGALQGFLCLRCVNLLRLSFSFLCGSLCILVQLSTSHLCICHARDRNANTSITDVLF